MDLEEIKQNLEAAERQLTVLGKTDLKLKIT